MKNEKYDRSQSKEVDLEVEEKKKKSEVDISNGLGKILVVDDDRNLCY